MKKVFGFILLGLGVVTIIRGIPHSLFDDLASGIGAITGVGIICFLPAYFLLRSKKHFEDGGTSL